MAGLLGRAEMEKCLHTGGPLPAISFHSRADPTVPFNGSVAWASQEQVSAMWAARARCQDSKVVNRAHTPTRLRLRLQNHGLTEGQWPRQPPPPPSPPLKKKNGLRLHACTGKGHDRPSGPALF